MPVTYIIPEYYKDNQDLIKRRVFFVAFFKQLYTHSITFHVESYHIYIVANLRLRFLKLKKMSCLDMIIQQFE